MKEYIVASSRELHRLIETVNERLAEGFTLIGGICCDETYFYQALAR